MPKQFLKLTNEYTMLQNTLLRVNKMISEEDNIYIIGNEEYSFIMDEQAKELNITGYKIITEPIGRDSAAAICIASLVGGEDDITMILPCDHIFDDEEFKKCFVEGMRYVKENSLITFGIKPSRVETGYGYIKIIEDSITEKFIEKPDYDLAKMYFKSGDYLWNAGVFLFKNSIITLRGNHLSIVTVLIIVC
jgi:mannose-1-phosphate guanylyltransferase